MLKSLGYLLAGLLLIGGGVAVWFQWEHMFWTALNGPTEISLAELAKIEDPKQLPSQWIRVKCEKVVETNVVVQRSDGAILTKYLLVQVGDRWMIAALKANAGVSVIAGQLYNSNSFENRDAIAAVVSKHQDTLRGHIFPFQLHGEVDYRDNGLYIPVVAALIAVTGLVLGCLGIGGMSLGLRGSNSAAVTEQFEAATDQTIDRILHNKGRRG
jgi:hypothetical protein